nr:PQQ-binding-like beta-propeller repeat protein [Rhodococcus sp. HNM0569]
MPPERRTRADLLVAAGIALVLVVSIVVVWARSDARGTESVTAAAPADEPTPADTVPTVLHELWTAPSPDTTAPAPAAGAVATADGTAVVGRDPATGAELWRYERDRDLCAVTASWDRAVAVYPDDRGCGQVTALDGSDGTRAAQRSSDADPEITLSADGSYVVARGDTRLELWRSDLVRTVEYGRVDAPVNPNKQPRSGCTLIDAHTSTARLAVLERCPGESADRLTLLSPTPKDAQEPEEYASHVLAEIPSAADGTRIIAVWGENTAVYLPGGGGERPRIGIYDGAGNLSAVSALDSPATAEARATVTGSSITWWSGTSLFGFSTNNLHPVWNYPGTIGPATIMAGRLLVPVQGGLAVLDPATGQPDSSIGVSRPPGTEAPVVPAVVGDVVLEQRGDTVTALR